MFSGLATGAKALGLRFTVSGLLPFTILIWFGFELAVVAHAPAGKSLVAALNQATRNAGPAGAVALVVVSFVLANVTEPFQISMVRLLEGYWGVGRISAVARGVGTEAQRRRWHVLTRAQDDAEFRNQDDGGYYSARIEQFPGTGPLLPTALGNALRAGERSAGERYGLDTVNSWPSLYFLLPESFHRDVGQLHGQVDGACRLCVALGLAAGASGPILLVHGWWNIVWISAALLSWAAYRGAVAAAVSLRVVLAAAYDIYRFDLLAAMHLPLPDDFDKERDQNSVLTSFLAGRGTRPLPPTVNYVHPLSQSGPSPAPLTPPAPEVPEP